MPISGHSTSSLSTVQPKDPPEPTDKRDPYIAVPSLTQHESTGVIRESFQKGRDQMVPITLLAVAVVLAFIMGAIFSGIVVYCVCDHRRRHLELPAHKKPKEAVNSRRGSMNSVTKLTGLFETQAKDGRPEAILTPLMHNGKTLIKAEEQQQLDLVALPTPESTPMQLRRKPSRASRDWERNQNLINACAKELASMGSPNVLIGTDLPLRASPGHIPSVVVLPLQQHQHQQVYQHQHEYVEQPHRTDLPDDQAATLEYKAMKSPCHSVMVDSDGVPPRVPQREASLAAVVPPAVPQMGKRLDMYCRGYPMGLKKQQHNTNSSNSSHLSRKRSFSRAETPPPAPQRLDSMHVSSPSGLSRHSSLSSYGSLPRCSSRHRKPDVPPKPSQFALSGKVKCSDSGT
ncbi:hypothetical protein PDJAM_G00242140 [Pangasius djambal]|uniref:Uncharacterized protein n=1 Tax=Pangasius djambal TaxID=1691987 RepID=A0ACC5YHV7_9TELE|nr:hypothetical protein [Pangasius djambal]